LFKDSGKALKLICYFLLYIPIGLVIIFFKYIIIVGDKIFSLSYLFQFILFILIFNFFILFFSLYLIFMKFPTLLSFINSINFKLPKFIESTSLLKGKLILTINFENIDFILNYLKNSTALQYNVLVDISVIDRFSKKIVLKFIIFCAALHIIIF